MSTLLEIRGLEAGYGASQVLFGVDLTVRAGEAVTLLGRNGMGKTTTVRAVLGLVRMSAGSVAFGGERIEGWPPDRIARRGIAVVPEGRQIFPNLTVEENLTAFAANRRAAREPWTPQRVFGLFPRLAERRRHMGNELSGGEQQMLAIGRALVTNPRLLILDEATEGLAPLIREEIWRCLQGLTAQRADRPDHRQVRRAPDRARPSSHDPGARTGGVVRDFGSPGCRPWSVAPVPGRVTPGVLLLPFRGQQAEGLVVAHARAVQAQERATIRRSPQARDSDPRHLPG